MEKVIACCGLNCATCDARIATLQNNDDLRRATAEKWQKMYNAPGITAESVNCTGCRMDGVKFSHCSVCEIRNCVQKKGYQTCGECPEMEGCEIVAMVHKHVPEAIGNLKNLN
ncbi:MAG: DUF3795 domain-containing protein [Bacteroidales bacterium]|nr:DUF3795 domain-containing protein [Bacteroidales bacterium]MBN2762296.1 DUF3795 domain-containing protein [Bacteroidales bacterium]